VDRSGRPKGQRLFSPVGILLKVKEAKLPAGVSFHDKDQHVRISVRIPGRHNYGTYALQCDEIVCGVPPALPTSARRVQCSGPTRRRAYLNGAAAGALTFKSKQRLGPGAPASGSGAPGLVPRVNDSGVRLVISLGWGLLNSGRPRPVHFSGSHFGAKANQATYQPPLAAVRPGPFGRKVKFRTG
jgi:hypothetical protein